MTEHCSSGRLSLALSHPVIIFGSPAAAMPGRRSSAANSRCRAPSGPISTTPMVDGECPSAGAAVSRNVATQPAPGDQRTCSRTQPEMDPSPRGSGHMDSKHRATRAGSSSRARPGSAGSRWSGTVRRCPATDDSLIGLFLRRALDRQGQGAWSCAPPMTRFCFDRG